MKNRGHFKSAGKEPRRGKGGKRNPPGGRPTKAQVIEREAEVRGLERAKVILEKEVDRQAKKIVEKYIAFAMKDPATLRHLVDRFLPAAKQEVEISSNVGITLRECTLHGDH